MIPLMKESVDKRIQLGCPCLLTDEMLATIEKPKRLAPSYS
jgi:hypothetical protein